MAQPGRQADYYLSSCQVGLYCDPTDLTCKTPQGAGQTCTAPTDCGLGTVCACDSTKGLSFCEAVARTQSEADALTVPFGFSCR
jgi:hypothetical protein